MAYFAISSVLRLWVNWNRFSWGAYIFGCLITVFTIALTQPPKYTVLSLLPLAVLLAAVIDYFNFSVTSSLPIEVDQEKQQIKCVHIKEITRQ
jgi:hypothetical protein